MNISIPWQDAPEWAKWAAMDDDGTWYWHKNKPELNLSNFMWGTSDIVDGVCAKIDFSCYNWQDTLTPRPSDK